MARVRMESGGQNYVIDVPEGVSVPDAVAEFEKSIAPKPSWTERFSSGIEDLSAGATQIIEHVVGKENFDTANKWLETHLPDITIGDTYKKDVEQIPGEDFDEYVTRRANVLNEKYGPGFDLARTAGAVTATLPFTPAKLLAARPLLGGTGIGSVTGAIEPLEHPQGGFVSGKASQAAQGAVGGLLGGALGKAGGAAMDSAGKAIAKRFTLPDILRRTLPQGKVPTQRQMTRAQTALIDALAKQSIGERVGMDKAAGGKSPSELLRLVKEANRQGIPITMADLADENLRGLIGNLARVPGPARQRIRAFLEARDAAEGVYLSKMVRRYLHGLHPGGNDTAYQTGEALIRQQSKASKPLYDALKKAPGVMSEKLKILLQNDDVQRALRPGIRFETNMENAEGRTFDAAELGLIPDEHGEFMVPPQPNMRVIDIVKKGLDAMIAGERNDVTGRLSQQGLGLARLRDALVEEVDSLDKAGVWKKARAAWAGPAASLDSLKLGRGVFSQHPEEFAAQIAKMSEENKDFVRVGAADAAIERILKTGMHGDEAKKIAGSTWARMQLQPLFRNRADYDAFLNEIDLAVKRFETKRGYMGGSQTAERLAEDKSPAVTKLQVAGKVLGELASGHPLGTLNAVRHLVKYWREVGWFKPDEKLNDAIAKIVLTMDEAPQMGQPIKRSKLPTSFNSKKLKNTLQNLSPAVRQIITQVLSSGIGAQQ